LILLVDTAVAVRFDGAAGVPLGVADNVEGRAGVAVSGFSGCGYNVRILLPFEVRVSAAYISGDCAGIAAIPNGKSTNERRNKLRGKSELLTDLANS
jgi:hypothetical protein